MFNFKPGEKQRLFFTILIGISVSALCIFMNAAGVFEPYELKTFDLMMQYLSKKSGSPDIVIVEVDQGSLNSLKKEGITWPWPRQVYSPIIDFLSLAGAKAVFLDILFTEPSSYGEEDDMIFAESIKRAGNVYLSFFLSKEERKVDDIGEELFEKYSLKVNSANKKLIEKFNSAALPIPELIESAKGIGNVQMPPDPDGVYRRIPFLFYYNDKWFPNLCIAYYYNEDGNVINLRDDSIQIGDKSLPYKDGLFRLKYYGGAEYYKRHPSVNLIKSYMDMKEGITPMLNPELFRGKYIFIGLTAPGLYDLKPTPVSSIYPATAVYATLFDNLLRSDYLIRIGRPLLFILIIVISALSSILVLATPSLLRNMAYFVGCILLLIFIAAASFRENILLDALSLLFSFTMSFTISAIFSYSTEGRQKREIKRIFSHYMNESLVEELLRNPDQLRLGGEKRALTVFFSDLKGFTSLSEKKSPEELVRLLNNYHTAMAEIIFNKGGIIDKYQGDGIMAFWGAPIKKEDDARQACLAALESQKRLSELRGSFDKMGFPPLHARIGINTGEMVVGNMGSERRFDYTVVGDNVNLASRLESVNKVYSTNIIVSESVYLLTKDYFEYRELDVVRVKGKEQVVRIYELLGEKGGLSDEKAKLFGIFEEGLSLYRKRKWDDAMERFGLCIKLDRKDGPSREYYRRCKRLLLRKSLKQWDGVYTIDTK
jgi:adenylate cyclase